MSNVPGDPTPDAIDTTTAHSARIWNYWLGGKDNYPVDREVGDQIAELFPGIVSTARQDRAFLGRAVRYLAAEAGIRQFLVHFILDDDRAHTIVGRLMDAVPSGSYLAIAHATGDIDSENSNRSLVHWNQYGKPTMTFRSIPEIAGFFDGLELVEPGVVSCSRWRPEATPFGPPEEVNQICGLARKP